ncbi:MAG: P-II family nitrogen regulator [Solirubrobacteraceae bacterium]|nr:P-II family nitrogen regulator [Solirubrobacteraceae bacterium]
MKLVIAYIRHDAFEPIRADLLAKGLPSMSVSDVKGTGRQRGVTEHYRGSSVTNYLRPKVRLEVGVSDEDAQTVIDTIVTHARTGNIGDGKIFVLPIEQSIRIRTGEVGEETMEKHESPAGAPSVD